jgi:N utilization substance protein A
VKEVRLDEETGTATVVVHDYQLSLAIGKEGQNARLAARLTGWRIDIKSETQLSDEEAGYSGEGWAEGEWIERDGEMVFQPAGGGEAISMAEWEQGSAGEAAVDRAAEAESPEGAVAVEVTETAAEVEAEDTPEAEAAAAPSEDEAPEAAVGGETESPS